MIPLLLLSLFLAQAKPAEPPKTGPTVSGNVSQPPALTEVQRLQLQNLTQRLELAQLRAQAAQREFDDARVEITKLLTALKVDGYTLDLATLSYTKDPPAPEASKQAPPPPLPPVKK